MNQGVIQLGIVGRPSTGKSMSTRNLDPKTTFFITPNKKDLPFRGSAKNYSFFDKKNNPNGNRVYCNQLVTTKDRAGKILTVGLIDWINYVNKKRPEIDTLIIEDITHFFHARTQEDSFRQSKDWGKWGDFAADVLNALINMEYRDGLRVVHIYHAEIVEQNGMQLSRIMTQGKALNNRILPSSYYTYMLHTTVLDIDDVSDPDERFKFITNNDGEHDCKTPHGLFDLMIPNDINMVLDEITKFRLGE